MVKRLSEQGLLEHVALSRGAAHRGGPSRGAQDGPAAPADRGLPGRVPRLLLGHGARRGRAAGARRLGHHDRADGRSAGEPDGRSSWRSDSRRRRLHRRAGLHRALERARWAETVEIRRVDESQPERLRYIASLGLVPGVRVTVIDRQPFHDLVTIEVGGQTARHRARAGSGALCAAGGARHERTALPPVERAEPAGATRAPAEPAGVAPASVQVPAGVSFWRKALAFAGPGYMVAVGYMDPGNWATDLAGGSRFGYTLLSVILISNLMAILLQSLAVKLGIVTGRDLAQACRDHYSRPVSFALWVLCEIAIAACDLAEVIGVGHRAQPAVRHPADLGRLPHRVRRPADPPAAEQGLPLARGLRHRADRHRRRLLRRRARPGPARAGARWRAGWSRRTEIVTNPAMLYIAIGILGATVMPHNLYLHSSIVQTRQVAARRRSPSARRSRSPPSIPPSRCSSRFFINAAILILAAATFHRTGYQNVADIGDAYQLLTPLLGHHGRRAPSSRWRCSRRARTRRSPARSPGRS